MHNISYRDKRQIGDLRTAEYLARITLDKNKLLRYLQMPTHCADIACGLVDVFERYWGCGLAILPVPNGCIIRVNICTACVFKGTCMSNIAFSFFSMLYF